MLDIAIIGAGPAGLAAAINGVIRNKKVCVFGNDPTTSYIYKAERVDNYIGMLGVSGEVMVDEFVKHAKEMGVEIKNGKVLEIFPMGEHYTLNVSNEFIEAKTVIIATGITKSQLMPGEDEFLGRGVSYCATCDGPLYREKTVALIGDSTMAEEEVHYLSEVCGKVYYLPLYKNVGEFADNVEVVLDRPKAIEGQMKVERLKLTKGEIEVEGIFIIKQSIPTTKLLNGLIIEDKAIKVNRMGETNFKGIYAAGDCTGRPYQVAKAVGEGSVAALQAVSYLHEKK